MGKGSDKMYITASEWSNKTSEGGLRFGGTTGKTQGSEFKRLPYYACALSLAPFEIPMMAPDGAIFDITNIVPFLKKHGVHPLTGEKLSSKDLVKLTFHKNAAGNYFCPITFKEFNDHTHIVAIRTSGQVYAFEAVQKLNYQAKNMFDLMTNDPFTKKDVVTIQDPHSLQGRNLTDFYYRTHGLEVANNAAAPSVNAVGTTSRALKELEAKTKEREKEDAAKMAKFTAEVTPSFVTKDQLASNAATFSNNRMAAGFTSTSFSNPQTKNERYLLDEEQQMFGNIKAKGYAAIRTNYGQLNLELHSDLVPKTVYNFVMLAKAGFYNGTGWFDIFRRGELNDANKSSHSIPPKHQKLYDPRRRPHRNRQRRPIPLEERL
jgi:peptidyl-prolyl cis-trans isomerase-like protein 2